MLFERKFIKQRSLLDHRCPSTRSWKSRAAPITAINYPEPRHGPSSSWAVDLMPFQLSYLLPTGIFRRDDTGIRRSLGFAQGSAGGAAYGGTKTVVGVGITDGQSRIRRQ